MIKTTRIKYSQSPRIIVDDLSPQCDGVTQVFKLSQPIPEWAPYCLVFNGQLYTNTSYKEWFTLDSDRQTIRTSFITPPTPGINKSLILIVGVAGMEDLGVDWADISNKPDLAMETDLETETAAREAADTAIRESIPTKTSDITNDSDYVSDANYIHTDNNFTNTLKNKLNGIESGAEANVQSDWSQNTTTADDFIKNKPTIPDVSGKRDLPTAATVYVVSQTAEIAVMNANTVYTVDPQATFTIVNIASTSFATSNLESQVWFTTGSTVPTVTVNSGIKIIGSAPTFAANKGYVLSVQNGVGVWGEYSVS